MNESAYLSGKLLLAMPGIGDSRFDKSVIMMCEHSAEGAMGIIINKPFAGISWAELLQQLEISSDSKRAISAPIVAGGPVEPGRGFVLHSPEYSQSTTVAVTPEISLTHTVDVLRDIAQEKGPEQAIVALGYAGWAPGQLDRELTQHGWLTANPDQSIVFEASLDLKWDRAIASLGINAGALASQTGHA